jgi:hypothetical protein
MLDMRTDLEGNHQVQRSEVVYNHPQFAGPVLATQYGWAKRGQEAVWEPEIHYSRLMPRAIEAKLKEKNT